MFLLWWEFPSSVLTHAHWVEITAFEFCEAGVIVQIDRGSFDDFAGALIGGRNSIHPPSLPHIVQKLRPQSATCHQQSVARSRAGDVEEVAFGVVDLFQIGVVGHRFDALAQG